MDTCHVAVDAPPSSLSDPEIVQRVRAGDLSLFELLMRRHNQRVYRTARAIVRDEAEVEDVMQQAYVNAFAHLDQFAERAQFSTWLIRITVNEAIARRNKLRQAAARTGAVQEGRDDSMETMTSPHPTPEHHAYARELQRVLEDAVDELPESYRVVFMLRDIEGLSTVETGAGLGLGEEAVKTRLHRARAMLRRAVSSRIGAAGTAAFQFQAPRCDRVVASVLAHVAGGEPAVSASARPPAGTSSDRAGNPRS